MKYYIKKGGQTANDAIKISEDNLDKAVIQAANFEWYTKRGWEQSWPITFTIIDNEKKEHDFEVGAKVEIEFLVKPK